MTTTHWAITTAILFFLTGFFSGKVYERGIAKHIIREALQERGASFAMQEMTQYAQLYTCNK